MPLRSKRLANLRLALIDLSSLAPLVANPQVWAALLRTGHTESTLTRTCRLLILLGSCKLSPCYSNPCLRTLFRRSIPFLGTSQRFRRSLKRRRQSDRTRKIFSARSVMYLFLRNRQVF